MKRPTLPRLLFVSAPISLLYLAALLAGLGGSAVYCLGLTIAQTVRDDLNRKEVA
jgi:hypothetical protein